MSSTKTILFLGATGGCALSALRRSLAAGHQCVVLARTPSKLTGLLPFPSYPNLTVVEGDACDAEAVSRALVVPSSASSESPRLVDEVLSSIGGTPSLVKLGNTDPTLCERAMKVLVSSVKTLAASHGGKHPRIIAISSAGASLLGRDIAIAMIPVYYTIVSNQLRDKRAMEQALYAADGEWILVRPSALNNNKGDEDEKKVIRVGVEDPKTGVESREIGYFISREGVGRWIFDSLIQDADQAARFVRKAATITY